MYLFALALCGLLSYGPYFLMYGIAEILLISVLWKRERQKNKGPIISLQKSIGDLVLRRVCSLLIWGVLFSFRNLLFSPRGGHGWETLHTWFPPDMHLFYTPAWHLVMVLAVCLIFTAVAFQMDVLHGRKWIYGATISLSALLMLGILTSAGLPLYWH